MRTEKEEQKAKQIDSQERSQGKTEEAFISGFCKLQNQTRTVICEYELQEDGSRTFLASDCAYGTCRHSKDCVLMGQAV